MNPAHLTIDEYAFLERFRPQQNHLDLTASYDFGAGGCLFSAAGKEFRHVLAQDRRKVWTLMDGADGTILIESGLHLVNRIGYLVTAEPLDEAATCTVLIDS